MVQVFTIYRALYLSFTSSSDLRRKSAMYSSCSTPRAQSWFRMCLLTLCGMTYYSSRCGVMASTRSLYGLTCTEVSSESNLAPNYQLLETSELASSRFSLETWAFYILYQWHPTLPKHPPSVDNICGWTTRWRLNTTKCEAIHFLWQRNPLCIHRHKSSHHRAWRGKNTLELYWSKVTTNIFKSKSC